MSPSPPLEIIPLGGLGEFGMNLMVYRLGGEVVLVDAGMMFPGAEHLGVDVVVPAMEFLDDCGTIHALLLTHGHEDHIGAIPFLLARRDVPVYGAPFTLGLVRGRLAEHDLPAAPRLLPLPRPGTPLTLGPFTVEPVPVSHSIPHAAMLVVRTSLGTIVHTGDFKLDPFPIDGEGTDLATLARLGDEGVLALLSDSTNAERPGFTPGERSVGPALDRCIAGCRGRVLVTTFSSNIHRIQQSVDVAVARGRQVALVGASVEFHTDVAAHLGLLRIPAGARVHMLFAAANRDPDEFDEPDRFDITRSPNMHLAFGFGIHHCLGASLARTEIRVGLDEFLDRFPDYRVCREDVVRLRSDTNRGFARLPVQLSA